MRIKKLNKNNYILTKDDIWVKFKELVRDQETQNLQSKSPLKSDNKNKYITKKILLSSQRFDRKGYYFED